MVRSGVDRGWRASGRADAPEYNSTQSGDIVTRVVLMLIFFICCSTGGEIAMTHGMKQVGEPDSFRPRALLRFIGRAIGNGWVMFAVPLLAASFYSLLVLLSWAPLSVVVPRSAVH